MKMKTKFNNLWVIFLCASVAEPFPSFAEDDAIPPINAKVLQYCNDHMGQKVGNGQCAGLAVQAIDAAGGRGRDKPYPAWNDYVWGREVCFIEGTESGTKVSSGSLSDVK